MTSPANLRHARTVAWCGLAALSCALVYAVAAGHFSVDARMIMENPWGLATLVDIYVGFALFSCWIVWRERRTRRALVWVVLVLATGNIASTIYVLLALRESRHNVDVFWHGEGSSARAIEDQT